MKIHLKSKIFITSVLFIGLAACHSTPSSNDYQSTPIEVSLAEDRSELEKLREKIPDEKKKENDELALLLNLMTQGNSDLAPNEIRNRYHRIVQKKRRDFHQALKKKREEFNSIEKKDRTAFLKTIKEKRDRFLRANKDPEERRRFNHDLSAERDRFFAENRERRQSFEEQLRTQQKDFDFDGKQRNAEFQDLLKQYEANYKERKQTKKQQNKIPTKRLESQEQ